MLCIICYSQMLCIVSRPTVCTYYTKTAAMFTIRTCIQLFSFRYYNGLNIQLRHQLYIFIIDFHFLKPFFLKIYKVIQIQWNYWLPRWGRNNKRNKKKWHWQTKKKTNYRKKNYKEIPLFALPAGLEVKKKTWYFWLLLPLSLGSMPFAAIASSFSLVSC